MLTEPKDGSEKQTKRSRSAVIQISEEQAEELCKTVPDETMSVSEVILIESAAEKGRVSVVKEEACFVAASKNDSKFPNQCADCSKSFKKPSDLVRHVRIHTGEKPYYCELCKRTFTVKSTLDSHLKTHTPGTWNGLVRGHSSVP